ncbi:hypothetical protein [Pelagicoccus sp. SDUM812003]|uniref:hypothetical protein n=1 Tax=Pelagicoccus sp. SDUM812003 TaxID=3041267 RepID=UPI00280F3DA0|nr:hypothetical protein [Pelagicoccus sp. SDUM812003]MDQ8202978.1 hypothetical protein [Pelagicoccus sp. SDUM812003]
MSAVRDDSLPNPKKWLMVGAVGLIVALIGFFVDSRMAAFCYLIGMLFTSSIVIGMLFLVMIHHIFDAYWSTIIRRQAENFLAALPWLGLLFIPLFLITYLGAQDTVWIWMNPDHVLHGHGTVGEDILYQKKTWWLSEPFFWARAVLCFAAWIYLARVFRRNSISQDADGSAEHTFSSRKHAAGGLVVVALTWSSFGFDWIMSLEYHWFSTMFGVWFFANAMRAALAVLVLVAAFLVAKGPLKGIFNTKHLHDLSTLCFAFTVFWAYISFSQYFLIWNGNIPEETFWYNFREQGMWWEVSMFLIFGHFLFPFLYMLQFPLKTKYGPMVFMACWILFMQLFDIIFNVLPSLKDAHDHPVDFIHHPLGLLWLVAALVGGAGVLLWAYWSSFHKVKIIPIRDPRIGECLNHNH